MSDTEDWVDVSKPTTLATMDVAAYTAFVSDTTNPAPVGRRSADPGKYMLYLISLCRLFCKSK